MLLSICALLLLAGCARFGGGGATRDPSAGKPEDPVSGTPGPIPSGGDGSQREESDPTVFDAHDVAVDRFTIGADGRTVVVYWWGGNAACFGLKEVRLDIQHGTPVLTVLEGTREAARGRMCTMEAVLKSTLLMLDAPIVVDMANPDPAVGEANLPEEAQRVEVSPGLVDARPNAVMGYRLSADGLELSIYYVGGVKDCYGLAAADVDRQGTDPLQVTIREGRHPNAGACDEIGVVKFVTVKLAQPLIAVATFDSEPDQPSY